MNLLVPEKPNRKSTIELSTIIFMITDSFKKILDHKEDFFALEVVTSSEKFNMNCIAVENENKFSHYTLEKRQKSE